LSDFSQKLRVTSLVDESDEGGDEEGVDDGKGTSIEAMYADADWDALRGPAETPPPVKRRRPPRSATGQFAVYIDKEHWTPAITRTLLHQLRKLGAKHENLVIAPVMGRGEIFAKGNLKSIEAVKPELAKTVLDHFPFAGLPENLAAVGVCESVRLDPADGQQYTLKAFWEKYKAEYTQPEVWGYWAAEMQLVGAAAADGHDQPAPNGVHEERAPRQSEGSSRPRGGNQAAARMLTRGLRDAVCPTGGGQQGSPGGNTSGGAAVGAGFGELRIPLDEEHCSVSATRNLGPALQRISDKYEHLKVAPVMGKCQIFAKGDLRDIEAAKPKIAEVILGHFPFADQPECLKVEGMAPERRMDPGDGRTYTLRELRDKYRDSNYSMDEIWGYWESRMRRVSGPSRS